MTGAEGGLVRDAEACNWLAWTYQTSKVSMRKLTMRRA